MRHAIYILAFLVISSGTARADVIAQWTFETSIPSTAGPHVAELGANAATAFASGFHAGATTYSNPVGNGSNESFNSNNWQIGDYYQFAVSTVGFQDITLNWDQNSTRSATPTPAYGPIEFTLAYSTDGVNFTNAFDYTVVANGAGGIPGWDNPPPRRTQYEVAFDLSGVEALDNASNVFFRLIDRSTVAADDQVVTAAGSSRIDNFTINGAVSAVPEPGAMLLSSLAFAGAAIARRLRKAAA
ncbi:hypothetical protein Pan44_15570 [Caulifigura coniformis]|uniref:Ice-binding protein C-terminal domain-containing protein n=1 Tax=Caulifigura coniformis TaxID=2527983 RepID=A0A517SBP1_9PLAN|nr:PEP-CTERM sorting domain-containing protein [Caulifigura coniformis]QDT53535.1 hypothetical protein Pan44_15570 [Caulifigura coniformis]